MVRIQYALLPGILLAILTMIFLTNAISQGGVAQASSSSAGINSAVASDGVVPVVQAIPVQAAMQPAAAVNSDNSCNLPARYPEGIRQWCSLIEKYAVQYGLESPLVAAVMLQESGGNADAYSSSGAVGLMQVMPRDGLAADFMCNGNPCFSKRPAIADLLTPEFNISYGVRMLAALVQKYGSTRDALKAYGPMDAGYSYADKVLSIFQNYR